MDPENRCNDTRQRPGLDEVDAGCRGPQLDPHSEPVSAYSLLFNRNGIFCYGLSGAYVGLRKGITAVLGEGTPIGSPLEEVRLEESEGKKQAFFRGGNDRHSLTASSHLSLVGFGGAA